MLSLLEILNERGLFIKVFGSFLQSVPPYWPENSSESGRFDEDPNPQKYRLATYKVQSLLAGFRIRIRIRIRIRMDPH
jgi:hypothetical protein